MNKQDYLFESFRNIQELIRFADSKVAVILVLIGLEITLFLDISSNLYFSLKDISIKNVILFLFVIVFIISILVSIFIALILVLKPSFAKHYKQDNNSTFYFGHIAVNTKEKFLDKIKLLDEMECEKEISEQIYEISKILNRKNKFGAYLIWLTLFSIMSLGFIVLLTRI